MIERQAKGIRGVTDNYISGYRDPEYHKNPTRFQDVKSACCKLSPVDQIYVPKLSFSGYEQNRFFHNSGGGAFEEVSGVTGLGRIEDGRSFVRFDFDRDGDEDLLLWNYRRNTILLLRNEVGQRSRSVTLRLQGHESNRDGIGSTIIVKAGGSVQARYLNCGEGYLSCHPPEVLVGTGSAETADIEIRWPSGKVQRFEKQATGAAYLAREDGTALERIERKTAAPIEPPAARAALLGEGDRFAVESLAKEASATVVILGSVGELDELAPLKERGCVVLVAPEDLASAADAVKGTPGRAEALPPGKLAELLGPDHVLPCILLLEKGVVRAKFIGEESGKRAAAVIK